MRKAYASPTLVENGDIVEQTRSGVAIEIEDPDRLTKNPMPGSIGFYL